MQLIVAEKPSVGRDLARVLGLRPSGGGGYIAGQDRVITWCVGHLVELDEPASYQPSWKAWRLDTLPMLPQRFRLRAVKGSRDQLQVVRGLLQDGRFTEVVNACDAGREGELIFRYVYELCGGKLPVRRLWISSLTDEAIKAGFQALKPGREYDPLGDAARCRSEADWLVGLNATRAVTVRHRTGGDSPLYSIGRVQTPTLALVVGRDEEIRKFVPRDYWEVRGNFTTATGESFEATFRHQRRARLDNQPLAAALITRLQAHAQARDPDGPAVERVQQKTVREPPPLLFDLTTLQRTANRRFGLSAARTLEIAQSLYETHKVLTYPRTDSRYLSKDLAPTLPRLFRALLPLPAYAPFAQKLVAAADGREAAPGIVGLLSAGNRRVFDDAKVEDHHAIIPTGAQITMARWEALDRDHQRVFDLVARRFLGAFFPDAVFAATELVVRVGPGTAPPEAPPPPARGPGVPADEVEDAITDLPPPPDRFFARGRVRLEAGWQEVAGFGGPADGDKKGARPDGEGDAAPSLPAVQKGQRLDGRFTPAAKQTRPPPRHTEATLLSAMETAGKAIEDEALRAAMKDTGLGTPATRAATIETLIKRGFITRAGKNVQATPTGVALIQALPVQSLASAELTGSWEARLARIARGAENRTAFMQDIGHYVTEVVDAIRGAPVSRVMSSPPAPAQARKPRASQPSAPTPPPSNTAAELRCPRCREGTLLAGKRGWGCSRWREGCTFVIWFEVAGKRLSDAQLRELVEKGHTRKAKWPAEDGTISGRLVLDLNADRERGGARLETIER